MVNNAMVKISDYEKKKQNNLPDSHRTLNR